MGAKKIALRFVTVEAESFLNYKGLMFDWLNLVAGISQWKKSYEKLIC